MAEHMKSCTDTTDTIDDAVLHRAIEVLSQVFKEQHGPQFFPGWERQTAMGMPAKSLTPLTDAWIWFLSERPGDVREMPDGTRQHVFRMDAEEEYADEDFYWPEAETAYASLMTPCPPGKMAYEWEDGSIHSEPEPLALLSYCDGCYKPLSAMRDEAMRATLLVCTTCGERQRVTDCDVDERLSEADETRLAELLARSQG